MVRAGVGALALLTALFAACGDGDARSPDASTGDGGAGGSDGGDGLSALELEWWTDPQLNDDPEGPLDLVVTHAKFTLEDIRVAGDAATLTRGSAELDFSRDDSPTVRFAPADPGFYASVIGRIAAYQVRGTIDWQGQTREFRIDDEPGQEPTFAVQLQDVEVLPGETTVVPLEIELDRVVEEIDWSMVEIEDGAFQIDRESDVIGEVREELAEAFRNR